MRPIGLQLGYYSLGVLALAASISGQTTRPFEAPPASTRAASPLASSRPASSQPATQSASTTQPASFGIDAASILLQLADSDWHKRKSATETLIRLGESGKPFIQELIRAAKTEEARNNAQAAIEQIDENRVSGPSYVTLHLKNAPPADAIAQLAPQTYSSLPTAPENLWQQGGFGVVNIDVDHVPFWEVAPKLCAQLGVDFRPFQNNLRIMRGGGQIQGLSHVEGAFLVVANQLNYTRTRSLGAGNREQTQFGMTMSVYPEPKITVLSGGGSVRIDEAVDDHGNSLLPKRSGMNRFMSYNGFGGFNLYASLQYPAKNPGTRMVRFRGSTTFLIQTKMRNFEIESPLEVHDLSTSVSGMQVTFRDLKLKDDHYELRVDVPQSSMSNPQYQSLTNQIQTRLRLLDAQGNELDHRGMGMNANGASIEFNLQFSNNSGGPLRKPTRLQWEIPLESRELTVPIRFTDIPLFEDN